MAVSLGEFRLQLALALSEIDGLTVDARPSKRTVGAGSGSVVIREMVPGSTFGTVQVRMSAIIVLGSNKDKAEQYLETWGPSAVAATANLDVFEVELVPEALPVGDPPTSVYALILNLSVEVE